MAELAQFVAATIQDKATLELLEENKKLKELLRRHNQLEICGKDGKPVLFRTYQQLDGSYTIDEGCNDKSKSYPLANLSELEIRIGGFFVTKLLTNSLCGNCERDGIIQFYFEEKVNGKDFSVTFDVTIKGWSEERQSSLERVEPEKFVETLMHSFPVGTSTATITFLNVTVDVN